MIRFVCTCGNQLEVPSELAGDSIQCPKCGLLTDVPTVNEQAQFTEEGTYKVDVNPAVSEDPDRMVELEIIYSKDKRDAEGHEIDLRTLPAGKRVREAMGIADDAFYDDAAGEIDLKPVAPEIGDRPKYDPETGELIRPLDVRKDPEKDVNPVTIPIAKAALSYAGSDIAKPVSPWGAAVALLMPMNLVVMFFVFVTHLFSGVMAVVALQVLFFIVPAFLILQTLILSHYGNVIDDIGRNEADDLPRPLRDLSWYDDLWSPFVSMFGGFLISFAVPISVLMSFGSQAGVPKVLMALIGMVIGTLIGPAVLLTTNTSGSTFNLRPDRLLHVIRICGWHYIVITVLWAIAWPVYFIGWMGFTASMLDTFSLTLHRLLPDGSFLVTVPALLLGIYLMHWFCWYLGLLYRAHHKEFPWILQHHVRDPNKRSVNHADKLAKRRRVVSGHLAVPEQLPSAPPPPPPGSAASSRVG